MGEYALYQGNEIKIGTCDNMYYLRYQDRYNVRPLLPNNVDPADSLGLRWRLPYPDEDSMAPGGYPDALRTAALRDSFDLPGAEAGMFQVTHASGLLLNVRCYHGRNLPAGSIDIAPHWCGRNGAWGLFAIKNDPIGTISPIVRCGHCGNMYRAEWSDVLPAIIDRELAARLRQYSDND